ncbi:MAG: hypothetical protein CME06_04895 [Gemmatimonadetes bacterium]|nr:hypothetical protein [Gemmatimonadota bacterium]
MHFAPSGSTTLLSAALLASVAAASSYDLATVARPDDGLLLLNATVFDPIRSEVLSGDRIALAELDRSLPAEAVPGVFIVQFDASIQPETRARVRAAGAEVLDYLPMHALVLRGTGRVARTLVGLEGTRWVGGFSPSFKIDEGIDAWAAAQGYDRADVPLSIRLFAGADTDAVLARLEELGIRTESRHTPPALLRERVPTGEGIELRASLDALSAVAAIDGVQWIAAAHKIEQRNSETRWVIQTNEEDNFAIWQAGLYGSGRIIGHIDGRIDRSHCSFEDVVEPGPDHRKIVAYRGSYGSDSHGTHTAATAAGDARAYGGGWGDQTGQAFGARLSHGYMGLVNNSNLDEYLFYAWQDGARVHTNSWGNDWTTQYTSHCQQIDNVSYSLENTVVCFAESNLNNLKTPENAKNVLAVGGTDSAPNQHRWCTGGKGPTKDGRLKPDLAAPGCSIQSAKSNSDCGTRSMGGTSMASPAVAGAVALVQQYFVNGYWPSGSPYQPDAFEPTGALVRAVLVNGAQDITGVSGYPSDQEGWGRIELEESLYLAGDGRDLWVADRFHADGLTAGAFQDHQFDLQTGEPLRITMAFSDYPASVNASYTPVNDLDLFVRSPSGTIYSGNRFAGGESVPGPLRDAKNNIEQVHVLSPEPGTWGVRVWAREVQMGDAQGWALAISGKIDNVVPVD